MHDDANIPGPSLLMVSLNHQPHRQCIIFHDLKLQTLLHLNFGACFSQIQEWIAFEISQVLVANFRTFGLLVVEVWTMKIGVKISK